MKNIQLIVDLKVFRHRGFSISVLTISFAFAAFGINVLTPLWLQSLMGYTATQVWNSCCLGRRNSIICCSICCQYGFKS